MDTNQSITMDNNEMSVIDKIDNEIAKSKKKLEELQRKRRRALVAQKEAERKARTQRLIITGANIEKVIGSIPDMGLLLGIIYKHRELFGKADSNDTALEYKLIGDDLLVQWEKENLHDTTSRIDVDAK